MEFFIEIVLRFLWWILLFPVLWLICAPFILAGALFGRRPYRRAVSELFGAVTEAWREWGLLFLP